jgi:hypothetical protein
MKPDYFIAHNGLPSILLDRSRHVITAKKSSDRVLGNNRQEKQQQIHPQAKNKRFIGCGLNSNQQAMQRDSEKNLRNCAIKESLQHSKSTKDLINEQIARNGWNLSAPKTDNECNRNAKR